MSSGVLRYGGSGSGTVNVAAGRANFIGSALNGMSLSCTPIELLANDGTDAVLAHATGFFWWRKDRAYLLTNWHVISGRNPFTGELNGNGYVPTRFAFYGMSLSVRAGVLSFRRERWVTEWAGAALDVFRDAPRLDGQTVDLWGVPIKTDIVFGRDSTRSGFVGAEAATCFLNDHISTRITTNIGDDCYILGYPLRNYDGLMPPVWKRASIASEPLIGIEARPMFLVDAATTPGMSGSPIVRKATTLTANDQDLGAIREFSSYDVIGIYAGRLESRELASVNLGYGWYQSLVDRLIDQMAWSDLVLGG